MDFDDVVNYISGFDPDFDGSITPATDEEITELEQRSGADLPDIYRGFLQTMGRSMGWIDIREIDFGIDAVLAFYRDNTWLPADEFIRIGSDPRDPTFDPYLTLSPFNDPEIMLIRASAADSFEQTQYDGGRFQLAGSLPEMVCMPVFDIYELFGPGRRPTRKEARRWRGEALSEADALVTTLGFETLPWSSEAGRAYRREDAAIKLVSLRGYPIEAWVRADDLAEQERLTERLGGSIGAA